MAEMTEEEIEEAVAEFTEEQTQETVNCAMNCTFCANFGAPVEESASAIVIGATIAFAAAALFWANNNNLVNSLIGDRNALSILFHITFYKYPNVSNCIIVFYTNFYSIFQPSILI